MKTYKNIRSKIRLLFRKDKEPYLQIKRITGFVPDNINVYKMALKHKSTNHKGGSHKNNERLEFLGDAVLGSVVADILYEEYDVTPEQALSDVTDIVAKWQEAQIVE